MKLDEVLSYFPFPDFRLYQKDILEKCVSFFNNNGRLVFLEAPTGFGKSAVNLALAKSFENTFYITPQKMLQDQVSREFKHDVAVIKGRSNYVCIEAETKESTMFKAKKDVITCDKGPCKRNKDFKCEKKDICHYWVAKLKALGSQIALMNFSYFLMENMIPEGATHKFGNRELLIIDEGHNVDHHILDLISVTMSGKTIPFDVFKSDSFQKQVSAIETSKDENKMSLIEDLIGEVNLECSAILREINQKHELSNKDLQIQEKIAKFQISSEKFLQDFKENEWIETIDKVLVGKESLKKISVQPIYLRRFGEKFIWSRAEYFIISSATIFPNRFIKEMGIPFTQERILQLSVPSTFPIENRKVIDASVGKLTQSEKEQNLPLTIEKIKQIISRQDCQGKGLIHCHSYQNMKYLLEHFSNSSRFIFHEKGDREDVLKEWMKSNDNPGKILVSVAMTEGLDLKDELCRFQICFKCPYPDLNNKRTQKRVMVYNDYYWYNLQALITLIQMYGRAVRHEKDWALFFYLDSSVNNLCKRYRMVLPVWFREVFEKRTNLIKIELAS